MASRLGFIGSAGMPLPVCNRHGGRAQVRSHMEAEKGVTRPPAASG